MDEYRTSSTTITDLLRARGIKPVDDAGSDGQTLSYKPTPALRFALDQISSNLSIPPSPDAKPEDSR